MKPRSVRPAAAAAVAAVAAAEAAGKQLTERRPVAHLLPAGGSTSTRAQLARGGLSDQISARQQQRNGARLNRRRRGEAQLRRHLTQGGGEAKRCEPAVSCGNRRRVVGRHG